MFTGLVEYLGDVRKLEDCDPGVRLVINLGEFAKDAAIGDSIAINGCCLTVVEIAGEELSFEAGPETLRCTNLGKLKVGNGVNLERSLKVGDRMGGHFVTGHVDATGKVIRREDDKDWSSFWFDIPKEISHQLASKGSIAVDGVSLTLVEVTNESFSVALIPHTLQVTTLGRLKPGDEVNLETDLLAKYVERQTSRESE